MTTVRFGVVTGSAAKRTIHTGRPKISLWGRLTSPFVSTDTDVLYGELLGRVSRGMEIRAGRKSLPPDLTIFDAMCKYLETRTRVDFAKLMATCEANGFGLNPSRERRNREVLRLLERFSSFLEDSDGYMFNNALLDVRRNIERNKGSDLKVEG